MTMAIPQSDGSILIQGPMQAPFTLRRNAAAVLGVPINRVRVKSISMGGGFGGKEDAPIDIGCRAAVLAAHTKRPVRLALEREEVTLQTAKRHPHIMDIKIGAKKDGTLVSGARIGAGEGRHLALGLHPHAGDGDGARAATNLPPDHRRSEPRHGRAGLAHHPDRRPRGRHARAAACPAGR